MTRALESAEFAVRTAEHQLSLARASLIQSRGGSAAVIPLYSPVNGVVLRRLHESEAVVATGEPLIEIGNVGDIEIVSDLLSSAAVRVRAGQPVRIEQWRVHAQYEHGLVFAGVTQLRAMRLSQFQDPQPFRPRLLVYGSGFDF